MAWRTLAILWEIVASEPAEVSASAEPVLGNKPAHAKSWTAAAKIEGVFFIAGLFSRFGMRLLLIGF
jgi:hypothetical protein